MTKPTNQNSWQGKQLQSELPRSLQLLYSNEATWDPSLNRAQSQGHLRNYACDPSRAGFQT